MINDIAITPVKVLDQDEALDFYVGKLGLTVTSDVDLGFMRWLTVAPADAPGHRLLLEVPGPPGISEEDAARIRDLLTKGSLGVACILATGDCRATYAELKERGVEFVQDVVEQPYGIDCALRDPFGNYIRISQEKQGPVDIGQDDLDRWQEGHRGEG
ncbi:VOC family protein [Nocardiopsis coralliicola]